MAVGELQIVIEYSIAGKLTPTAKGPIPPSIAIILPEMYRSVEGQGDIKITRTHEERIVFGRTRTLIDSSLPGFEGEFLEPQDIQEYLELIGVIAGGANHSDVWIPYVSFSKETT